MESGTSHGIPFTTSWISDRSPWATCDLPELWDTVDNLISHSTIWKSTPQRYFSNTWYFVYQISKYLHFSGQKARPHLLIDGFPLNWMRKLSFETVPPPTKELNKAISLGIHFEWTPRMEPVNMFIFSEAVLVYQMLINVVFDGWYPSRVFSSLKAQSLHEKTSEKPLSASSCNILRAQCSAQHREGSQKVWAK